MKVRDPMLDNRDNGVAEGGMPEAGVDFLQDREVWD